MGLNGFSACQPSTIGVFKIPGTRRSMSLRRETAAQFLGFMKEFHELVEPIDKGTLDDWGYFCRKQRGGATLSFHAIGGASDLNALRHPMGVRGTFNARQKATILRLCQKYGLRWGGTFQRRADEMHVEQALQRPAALALCARLKAKPVKTASVRAVPRLGKLVMWAKNSDVVLLQKRLIKLNYDIEPDGIYGPETRKAVAAYQHKQGWSGSEADGLVGKDTLAHLF